MKRALVQASLTVTEEVHLPENIGEAVTMYGEDTVTEWVIKSAAQAAKRDLLTRCHVEIAQPRHRTAIVR